MKALVVSQVYPPRQGGSGRWLWELYRRLSASDIALVAGEAAGSAAFDRQSLQPIDRVPLDFAAAGLFNASGARSYWRAFRRLRAIVRARHSTVLHCGKCLPEGLLALAIKWSSGLPYVCYVHGEELGLARTSREQQFLTARVLRSAQMVVANSHHSKRLVTTEWGVPETRVVVLHPGVDIERFVPAPGDASVRASLGWAGRRVVLTVGALQQRKGQDMMIRALPAIRAACPDVLYAMAGEGWERPALEQLALDHGVTDAIQFLGSPSDSDVCAALQQCDLFVLANRRVGWDFEGFGIALIEAQACGRPVIAGNSGGAPETMVPDETGLLVNCEQPDALAAAVISLLNDATRRAAMGAAARAWVERQFAWPALAKEAASRFGVPLGAPLRTTS